MGHRESQLSVINSFLGIKESHGFKALSFNSRLGAQFVSLISADYLRMYIGSIRKNQDMGSIATAATNTYALSVLPVNAQNPDHEEHIQQGELGSVRQAASVSSVAMGAGWGFDPKVIEPARELHGSELDEKMRNRLNGAYVLDAAVSEGLDRRIRNANHLGTDYVEQVAERTSAIIEKGDYLEQLDLNALKSYSLIV